MVHLEKDKAKTALKDKGKYTFNNNTKKYIFHTDKKFGKNYVFTQETVNDIIRLYSNYDDYPYTMGEISKKTSIPLQVIKFILAALNITHDSLPFSDQVVQDGEEDVLVEEALANKRFSILQKFERQDWRETEKDAELWRGFMHKTLNPFETFLSKWSPPKLNSTSSKNLTSKTSNKIFTVVLSDLHFGASANSLFMFNRPDWNTQKTVQAVDKYSKEIIKEVSSRNYKFEKCVIISLGDLIHSMLGKTARGTELVYDTIREEQFDYALNSLVTFIQRMVDVFGKVECHDVGGNHHYELDMALFRALDMYFKQDKRITFNHYSTRPAAFKCAKTLIMIDHGADSKERVYVPNGAKLEKHVQTIMINNPHLLDGVKTKLFIQGDKHHFEHLEFSSFEYIMFGTILGSDEHAATNNWHNRARQSIMVIDDSGLREVIHVYFDEIG